MLPTSDGEGRVLSFNLGQYCEIYSMSRPVWVKQLDEKFCLLEYPQEELDNSLNCVINFKDELHFSFNSWGCDRETITPEDCLLCCRALREHDIFKSISSFASNLESQKKDEYFSEIFIKETKLSPPIKVCVTLWISDLLLRKIRKLLLVRDLEFEALIKLLLDNWAWDRDPEMPPEPFE